MWLLFSILAAISFGMRGILYHWTSQQALKRNTLLCGTFFMGAFISLVCSFVLKQEWTITSLVGIQMGLFSYAANASMFKGFKVGKASVVAILTALPAVLVVIGAYFMWGERLNFMQLIAFAVIVIGVLLVRYSNDITIQNLQGAQWGLLALCMFAANDLTGKWSTIVEAPMFPTLFFMFVTGTLCFGFGWIRDYKGNNKLVNQELAASSENSTKTGESSVLSEHRSAWSEKRTFLVGMGIGISNIVGMVFILIAFEYGKAGLVSAVVALNVFLVLLYTRFFVKERFTKAELAGVFAAIAGILFLRLYAN